MEGDAQRIFSVLTRRELRDKITEAVNDISDLFTISKSDAMVILIRLQWKSFLAKICLSGDKKRLMNESGLVHQNGIVFSCEHHENHFDENGKISTPYCSHKYCKNCWIDHVMEFLKKNNKEGEERVMPLCPYPDCIVPVGSDTIEKIKEPEVKKMYDSYVVESFMKGNKETIKWCPQQGCINVISLRENADVDDESPNGLEVTCNCGYISCWSCQLECHKPVTCEKASDWLHDFELAKYVAFNIRLDKCCPNCNSPVWPHDVPASGRMTCTCSYRFCWRCFRSEEEHKGKTDCFEVFDLPTNTHREINDPGFDYLPDYMILWEETEKELKKDQAEVEFFEVVKYTNNNFGYNEQDVEAIREAFMMVIRCRLVQKWSCAYDNYVVEKEIARKQYVTHLRGEANRVLNQHVQTFKALVRQAVTSDDFSEFKVKLSESTANTGKCFGNIVKIFEDDLPEVKIDDASEYPPNGFSFFWLCDRCTFQNTRFSKECKMCFAPFECSVPARVGSDIASSSKASAPRVGSDIASSSKASAHHQEVPDSSESDE